MPFTNAVRMSWSLRGYMYFVYVRPHECLDVARGLWLTGAHYVSVYTHKGDAHWSFSSAQFPKLKRLGKGGYSNP